LEILGRGEERGIGMEREREKGEREKREVFG
jgi:hypothetical protein